MSTILSSYPETSIWSAPSAPLKLHSRAREAETACRAGVSITKSLERIEIPLCIYESCDGLGLLSKDPIGFAAGDTNLYRMTGNHPNMATDPSGLFAFGDDEDGNEYRTQADAARSAFVTSPFGSYSSEAFFKGMIYDVVGGVSSLIVGQVYNDLFDKHGTKYEKSVVFGYAGSSSLPGTLNFLGGDYNPNSNGNRTIAFLQQQATLSADSTDKFGSAVGHVAAPLGDEVVTEILTAALPFKGIGVGASTGRRVLSKSDELFNVLARLADNAPNSSSPVSETKIAGYLSPTKISNPWMPSAPRYAVPAPKGLEIEMVMSPGQTRPGGWGTVDVIADTNYARNQLAITPEFKPELGFVQKFSVPEEARITYGTVGPQTHGGVTYSGGGTQIQILNYTDRVKLVPIGPKIPLR